MSPQIESGLWILLSLLAQPMAKLLWPKVREKAGDWGEAVEAAGPWLLAISPMYLSLMTGAVLGGRLGLYGFGLERSLLGALAGGVIMVGLFLLRRYRTNWVDSPTPPDFQNALQDELRWAFYRGAAGSWLSPAWLGSLAGLGLAAVEWLLAIQAWKSTTWRAPDQWMSLVRAGVSTGLFVLSGNLWLVIVIQMLVVLTWRTEPVDDGHGESEAA
jgi:hypothetical protein